MIFKYELGFMAVTWPNLCSLTYLYFSLGFEKLGFKVFLKPNNLKSPNFTCLIFHLLCNSFNTNDIQI